MKNRHENNVRAGSDTKTNCKAEDTQKQIERETRKQIAR